MNLVFAGIFVKQKNCTFTYLSAIKYFIYLHYQQINSIHPEHGVHDTDAIKKNVHIRKVKTL